MMCELNRIDLIIGDLKAYIVHVGFLYNRDPFVEILYLRRLQKCSKAALSQQCNNIIATHFCRL